MIKIDPKVLKFAETMQNEINQNSRKGNWEDWQNPEAMFSELEYHKQKLIKAFDDNNESQIKEYLADCANILMFIGNTKNLY